MSVYTPPRGARRGICAHLSGTLKTLIIAVALGTSGLATPVTALDVRNDNGGSVEARVAEVERLRSQGVRVRILGTCLSACTLYLGLPNTCVSPGAKLGFHGPSTRHAGLPLPHSEFERLSAVMASYYPGEIRNWFWQEARMRTKGLYTISGAQAIRMGARACA